MSCSNCRITSRPNSSALARAFSGPTAASLCGRPADVDHEADVGGEVVDRRDRRDGAVVDHPPALGHRDAQTAVDGLHAAVDVLDQLGVVALERDREVDERHRLAEVVAGEDRHDRGVVHVLEMREVHAVFEHVLRMQFQALADTTAAGRSSRRGCCRRENAANTSGDVEERLAALRRRARCTPTRCARPRDRCARGGRGWADPDTGCRRCGRRRSTASRGTGTAAPRPRPCRRSPGARRGVRSRRS